MKKQIITIVAVALAAVLLFTVYSIFFRDSGIDVVGDPFYTLGTEVGVALAGVDEDIVITLSGYDGSDDGWEMISRFSGVIADANKKIKVRTEASGSLVGVKVSSKTSSEEIAYDSFFKANYEGTRYAFDGEALIVNAVLSLCGKDTMNISLRALDGYDTDGDIVTAGGAPFMFPSFDRNRIAFLTIENANGKYSIYQDNGSYFFSSTRAAAYDDEKFSLLTTNCRYVVTYGKFALPEGKSWGAYGLDIDNGNKPATANYTIMTTNDKNGNYFLHSVYIGSRASSGTYYYARYVGGLFEPSGKEGESDKLIQNLTKEFIYQIPASSVEGTIDAPETEIMKPTIVNSVTDNQALMTIDNVRIDDYKAEVNAVVRNFRSMNAASNLSAKDSSSLTVISDKVSADKYSSYSGGWAQNTKVFGGFTSSNGNKTYIEALLARYAKNGEYKVKFGLVRDEANGAYLPGEITVTKSADGINWLPVENGTVSPSQKNGEIAEYEISFTDEDRVKFIRVGFDVPQIAETYVVFDELRIYADGADAQPKDSVGGIWRLMTPDSYISDGMNYAFLDMNNFNNFVQSIAALEGERVVACGFGNNGDASTLDEELLAEYGLDDPEKHFSFEYNGVVTDVYVSAPNEDGKYYAYSTFTGVLNGESICATTDVIVELSTETADWLGWSFVEYLDHSLVSIYLIDITDMTVSFDGNDYRFDIVLDEDGGDVDSVGYQGKSLDVKSFKYLYQSILSIYMQDEYVPSETDKPEEYLRIKINTETNSPELVFYRVSSTKCYFTVNGEGSYYALAEEVKLVRDNLLKYISGGILTRDDT